MGPSSTLWRLEPRCHCSIRRMLHTFAYPELETTQVRNLVRITFHSLLSINFNFGPMYSCDQAVLPLAEAERVSCFLAKQTHQKSIPSSP